MHSTESPATNSRWHGHRWLWAAAVLFFVVGDAVTTSVGLGVDGIVEAGPVTAPLLDAHGLGILVILKLAVVGVALVGWALVPRPYRSGIPLGLATVGLLATAWNVRVLLHTLL